MKNILSLTLVLLTSFAYADDHLCKGGFGEMTPHLDTTFYANAKFPVLFRNANLAPADISDTASWGGTMSTTGVTVTTKIHCVDGDQFFQINDQTNRNNYCVIDAGTENGDERVVVYREHGLKCQLTQIGHGTTRHYDELVTIS